MSEQIERLKDNLCEYWHLTDDNKELLRACGPDNLVMLSSSGRWLGVVQGGSPNIIYRIHRDYQPEPAQPKFPGMVLCKVVTDEETGNRVYKGTDGAVHLVSAAIGNFCQGYVFMEAPDVLWGSPVAFVLDGECLIAVDSSYMRKNNVKPATLAFVAFPEEK